MKFKKERDEEERLERAAKIRAHLAKTTKATPGTAKAEPQAEPQASAADLAAAAAAAADLAYDNDRLNWSPDEELANTAKLEEAKRRVRREQQANEEAKAQDRLANPHNVKLYPWERLSFNKLRAEQFRPMTRAEREAFEDAQFLKKCFDEDQAHRAEIKKFQAQEQAEQEAAQKRAEKEARTGMRPYEPGRYCSVEEAYRRGYLSNEPSEEREDR